MFSLLSYYLYAKNLNIAWFFPEILIIKYFCNLISQEHILIHNLKFSELNWFENTFVCLEINYPSSWTIFI